MAAALADVFDGAHQGGQGTTKSVQRFSLLALTAMVVGSIVGSGIC